MRIAKDSGQSRRNTSLKTQNSPMKPTNPGRRRCWAASRPYKTKVRSDQMYSALGKEIEREKATASPRETAASTAPVIPSTVKVEVPSRAMPV